MPVKFSQLSRREIANALMVLEEQKKPFFNDENRNASGRMPKVFSGNVNYQSSNYTYASYATASAKAPSVLFKLISSASNNKSISGLINYLNKDNDVRLESSHGVEYKSPEEISDLTKYWQTKITDAKKVNKYSGIKHGVLSFPKGTDEEKVSSIVRASLGEVFGERGLEYVTAAHFGEKHAGGGGMNPHVHFFVDKTLPDRTMMKFNKDLIFEMRHVVSERAREQGVILHPGMSYEKGLNQRGVKKAEVEQGYSRASVPLRKTQLAILEKQFDAAIERMGGATIRTDHLDKMIENHINDLDKPAEKQLDVNRSVEADFDISDDL